MAKLSQKQERFIEEYLVDLNGTQAAIRAGYSARTAGQQAEKMLKKPEIANAVSQAKRERSERTKIDADWLLNRLADEATADVSDLYDDNGEIRPVGEWPLIWRQGLVAGLDVEHTLNGDSDGNLTPGKIVKIKLSDRVKRLEMIGKHIDVQAFNEKHTHEGNLSLIVTSGIESPPGGKCE